MSYILCNLSFKQEYTQLNLFQVFLRWYNRFSRFYLWFRLRRGPALGQFLENPEIYYRSYLWNYFWSEHDFFRNDTPKWVLWDSKNIFSQFWCFCPIWGSWGQKKLPRNPIFGLFLDREAKKWLVCHWLAYVLSIHILPTCTWLHFSKNFHTKMYFVRFMCRQSWPIPLNFTLFSEYMSEPRVQKFWFTCLRVLKLLLCTENNVYFFIK